MVVGGTSVSASSMAWTGSVDHAVLLVASLLAGFGDVEVAESTAASSTLVEPGVAGYCRRSQHSQRHKQWVKQVREG